MALECRDSVLESSYKDIEVLIINENKKRSEQRNIGIKRAVGEYILYLDSDQKVSPYLISECVQLTRYGYNGIFIPEIITTKGFFGKVRNFERSFYNGTAIDCVRFFKRENCPFFSTDLDGPEDALHSSQVKGLKTVCESPLYHHDQIGIVDYFKKKIHYSKSMKRYAELNPSDKCLDLKYRCLDVFIDTYEKRIKIIKNPILFLGVIFLIIMRGMIYFTRK